MNDFAQQPFIHFKDDSRPWARWLLAKMGWQLHCDGFPSPWGVAIVYPHTSNWDFVVMILAKWAIGVPAHFIAKDSLFKWPVLGRWLRYVGGLAVDRKSPHGVVGQIVQTFADHQRAGRPLWLGLTPEGTRSYVSAWRSGFYNMALEAQLPLGLVELDYAHKSITFTSFLHLSGDVERDIERVASVYATTQGKYPDLAGPIVWRVKDKAP
jgi:1-acyl-sn-glycerol-3-phosphate acyltransferase